MSTNTQNSLLSGGITITQGPTKDGSRYIGGHDRGAGDHPFLTGNFYVFFSFPSTIFNADAQAAQNYLLTSAEDYTPHADGQVKIVDVEGQGGVGASFISGRTTSREFSITYKDFWGAPIFKIHRKWSFINPYFGGSDMAVEFSGREYKGTCMVIETKPVVRIDKEWTASDIIKVAYYDGVFPKIDLSSAYSATIADNTLVRPSVQYSFDGFPLDETNATVLATAVTTLKNAKLFDNTKTLYEKLASTAAGATAVTATNANMATSTATTN